MKNRQVHKTPASAAVYRVTGNEFKFESDDFALEYGGNGLLKKNFQEVHKGEADEATTERFVGAYGQKNQEEFQTTMRTVGAGTNIIFKNGEGTDGKISIPMVGRTNTGPDGVVALGKQSRAAGGADGDIAASGFRELQEEFLCIKQGEDGGCVVYTVVYDDESLDPNIKSNIIQEQQNAALVNLREYDVNPLQVSFQELEGKIISVPGLTTSINQVIDGVESCINNRILTDNPSAGDFAGVDTLVYVRLPEGVSANDLIIYDGETDFDGNLLKRIWSIETAEEWRNKIESGMPISPAPKQVFDNWDIIEPIIANM